MLLLLLLALCPALAGNVSMTEVQRHDTYSYSWVLATNQTSSGASETAVNVQYYKGSKVLEIDTAGSPVNIAVTVNEDANGAATKNLTITSAGATKLATMHHITSLYVTSAITSGSITSIQLSCE